MRLTKIVEELQQRPLTQDEHGILKQFQEQFDIDDDDPITVVLAIMLANKITLDSIPKSFFDQTTNTIELHQQLLRDQSILISKEIISTVSTNILAGAEKMKSAHYPENRRKTWLNNVAWLAIGMAVTISIIYIKTLFR
jgi:hypothetical protein